MADLPKIFEELLGLAVENGASDVHLKAGRPALMRVAGELVEAEMAPLTAELLHAFVDATLPTRFRDRWVRDNQIDYSFDRMAQGKGRFRVNAFLQRNQPAAVLRLVKVKPPQFAELNLDEKTMLQTLELMEGLVLVCGPTGSGKSSTIAAMLRHVNENSALHVITLEDPVEYVYADERSSFSQREIGIDVESFPMGLRAALRQDPDVILVGEMRDKETFETALHAAETGHLVLTTLHAGSAQQAVQRLFEFFPAEQLSLARRSIAASLKAVLVQTLVPRLDGQGVLPVMEVFIVDGLAKRLLADGQFERVPELVEGGADVGSRPINQDLVRLVRAGKVSKAAGLAASPNPKAFEMNLSGISIQSGRIIQ
ncbi:twitching mobility protein [Verrucomicrobiota bacterium]|nr:twitching mobility protein [Verrucomicrobiota bacterium]